MATAEDDLARKLPEAPLHAVSHDGVADLLAHRETDPDAWRRPVGRDRSRLEDEARHGTAAPGLDAQEIPAIWQSPGADRRHGLMAPARPTGACGPSGDDWR